MQPRYLYKLMLVYVLCLKKRNWERLQLKSKTRQENTHRNKKWEFKEWKTNCVSWSLCPKQQIRRRWNTMGLTVSIRSGTRTVSHCCCPHLIHKRTICSEDQLERGPRLSTRSHTPSVWSAKTTHEYLNVRTISAGWVWLLWRNGI